MCRRSGLEPLNFHRRTKSCSLCGTYGITECLSIEPAERSSVCRALGVAQLGPFEPSYGHTCPCADAGPERAAQ